MGRKQMKKERNTKYKLDRNWERTQKKGQKERNQKTQKGCLKECLVE